MKLVTSYSVAALTVLALAATGHYWSRAGGAGDQQNDADITGELSIAANLLWQASKRCVEAGLDDIEQCASNDDDADDAAGVARAARGALAERDYYYAACLKTEREGYCVIKLNRAIGRARQQEDPANTDPLPYPRDTLTAI